MLPERTERIDAIAQLSNEYATIALTIDDQGNDPRLRVSSLRDQQEQLFDPTALSLLCHADETVLAVLADLARDPRAREELKVWVAERRARSLGSAPDGEPA